jgi:hypothetical protein
MNTLTIPRGVMDAACPDLEGFPPCGASSTPRLHDIVAETVTGVASAVTADAGLPGAALNPRGWHLIALLVQGYCLGIYSSSEIVAVSQGCYSHRCESTSVTPEAGELRGLRRSCRPLVERCVASVLGRILRLRQVSHARNPGHSDRDSGWVFDPCFSFTHALDEDHEAEGRVHWAVRVDSMEQDE